MVFEAYARFYDALYRDKDYGGECRYLEKLFRRHEGRRIRSVLDLGCGTGSHDLLLADKGYAVTGVDRSAKMLAAARSKAKAAALPIRFRRGDIRSFRLGETFDAVLSMFAVIGYQTSDKDVRRALKTVARHLKPRGLFICDLWFGPAVLHDPPGRRRKTVLTADGRIERSTTCRLDLLRQVVEVRFRTVRYRGRQAVESSDETHPMRFFFPRELALLLDEAGLELRLLVPFLKLGGQPDHRTWNVTVAAVKRGTSG